MINYDEIEAIENDEVFNNDDVFEDDDFEDDDIELEPSDEVIDEVEEDAEAFTDDFEDDPYENDVPTDDDFSEEDWDELSSGDTEDYLDGGEGSDDEWEDAVALYDDLDEIPVDEYETMLYADDSDEYIEE